MKPSLASHLQTSCRLLSLALLASLAPTQDPGSEIEPKEPGGEAKASEAKKPDFSGLRFREIGPASTSGRIGDIAIHPAAPHVWYVAACSGGVWKTSNAGTSWTPIFDHQGSYSIGCVTIAPGNPEVIWVGTGENNSQRSVSYGDGVYRSADGGKSFEKVGLGDSEHIGRIVVHPLDADVVWVAAQGPLWKSGGERGVYKTSDGGKTWRRTLHVDDDTGANEVWMDPRDPHLLYATTYQRRRTQWTLVDGGPGSAVWRSTDGGETWTKTTRGLPGVDLGRIGLAVSPVDPDVVYAVVEAAQGQGGFYRSRNRGVSWEKRGPYVSPGPQYYNELVADPCDVDRVYAMDTLMQVSDDGGATFRPLGERHKHVDNHALWIAPGDCDHLIAGCDGGVYQSFDRGATWAFCANLPVTQFYKVGLDMDLPFYRVYGGTQDNYSLGAQVRNDTAHGIGNEDWFVTVGGDGFQTRVDPTDSNIVYSEWQYGGLVRFHRDTGERVDIQPQPGPGDPPYRLHWDAPLIISPHAPSRLYFGGQFLFRSDDRGDSWRKVSSDLTRQIDRNTLPVMGRVQSVDAVAKNASTSFYGNIVALDESPRVEGLLFVGTDDGLVQVSDDGGGAWREIQEFPGVPANTYVSDLCASPHDDDRVYASFDNHKAGDFAPYLMRSDDRGRTWTSIASDLPARGTVYCVAEDHGCKDLLFAGTEFGVYCSRDGGGRWLKLGGGLPTVCVRDLALHPREHDLVLATFGRGFWVLDDYSPLRTANDDVLAEEGHLFAPARPAWLYVPRAPLGGAGKAFRGETHFLAANPPFGAVFTYHLKDGYKTRQQVRREAEKKAAKAGEDTPYPSWEELRAEDDEDAPELQLVVTDAAGHVVRRVDAPTGKGLHRVAWDLRRPAPNPAGGSPRRGGGSGLLVAPGRYTAALQLTVDGEVRVLGTPRSFEVASLPGRERDADTWRARETWAAKAHDLARRTRGGARALSELETRVAALRAALDDTTGAPLDELAHRARSLRDELRRLHTRMFGDETLSGRNEPALPGLAGQANRVIASTDDTTQPPTATHAALAASLAETLATWLEDLAGSEQRLRELEDAAERAGAPWTPGRLPRHR
ncbi:MAG: glycosyl hydrolase [Planctomycetota bacterium]